jgi:hypothetical protein
MNQSSKNNLIICELHNPIIHGKTDESYHNIENHYLVYDKFDGKTGISLSCLENYDEYDTDEEFDTDEELDSDSDSDSYDNNDNRICKIDDSIKHLRTCYKNFVRKLNYYEKHPSIRNYDKIISRKDYIKKEIGYCIVLPTQETIAILKTFWLRIVQRKWKNIFKQRQIILKKRNLPSSLYQREIGYNWLQSCNNLNMPSLKGMLYNLPSRK